MYKIIKDATYEGNQNNIDYHLMENTNGRKFDSLIETVDFCNNHYINIDLETEKAIPKLQGEYHVDVNITKSIFLKPITKHEIINYIAGLKNYRSLVLTL